MEATHSMNAVYDGYSMSSLSDGMSELKVDQSKHKKRPVHILHQQPASQTTAQFHQPASSQPFLPPQVPFSQQPQSPNFVQGSPQIGTPQMGTPPLGVSQFGTPQGQIQSPGQLHQTFSPPSNLDPTSVPDIRYETDVMFDSKSFLTFANVCPPLVGTQYTVVDQGNASPRFMRMSMYNVPATEKLRKETGLSLGLVLNPFAPMQEQEKPIPEVDYREMGGPPRCRRCRAYVNSTMQHTHDYRMICNICGFSSPIPSEYCSPLDPSGVRIDRNQRPELHLGMIDFLVPEAYNIDESIPPNPLHHVFLVDISNSSVRRELHKAFANAISMSVLKGYPKGSKISIIAYDRKIHFFNLSLDSNQVSIATVSDLEDPFLPFFDGIFVDVKAGRIHIDRALQSLEMMGEYSEPEPAYGAALRYALLALEHVGGGKVTALLSALPSWGPGSLKGISPSQRLTSELETEALTAKNQYYQKLSKDYISASVGLDLFVVSSGSVDLSDCSLVATSTGGSVRSFFNYEVARDQKSLCISLLDSIQAVKGYQSQLKIRCSAGLQVTKYLGSFKTSNSDADPLIPIVTSNTSVGCLFKHDGKLSTKNDAHFQAALLYTSADGVRKVRVINSIISVTERIADVFAFADQDATLALELKEHLGRIPEVSLVGLRNRLTFDLVDINTDYKLKVVGKSSADQQLILPVGLRTLPMFTLAATKTRAIRSAPSNNTDLRVQSILDLKSFTLEKLAVYLYPILINVLEIDEDACQYTSTGHFQLPPGTRLSRQNLMHGGAYILFNGLKVFFWIHSDVNVLLLQDVFGQNVSSLDSIDPNLNELPELDTGISLQLRNLVSFFAKSYLNSSFVPIQICRFRRDGAEVEFMENLYEDSTPDKLQSYHDFLNHIHSLIKNKVAVSSEKKNQMNGQMMEMNHLR
ncbi:COPII coat Sec23p-Sfb3p heterodimer component [Komagataella phaffii]|uniref:Lst1p n=1 Tax=Komagataella pastoris TaxID=4922 RepID=Q0PVD7_PICPA|nr:Lst1p [Komagataella pastoris]AOA64764.1 GQ67_04849T0 [Komagataella phaffii]CAH2450870.1 COPII coat Sec23p-Sfb3p heterodimer component [Komagataella phaffii CBS 7435]